MALSLTENDSAALQTHSSCPSEQGRGMRYGAPGAVPGAVVRCGTVCSSAARPRGHGCRASQPPALLRAGTDPPPAGCRVCTGDVFKVRAVREGEEDAPSLSSEGQEASAGSRGALHSAKHKSHGMAVCPRKGSSSPQVRRWPVCLHGQTRRSWEGETGCAGNTAMPDLLVSSYSLAHLVQVPQLQSTQFLPLLTSPTSRLDWFWHSHSSFRLHTWFWVFGAGLQPFFPVVFTPPITLEGPMSSSYCLSLSWWQLSPCLHLHFSQQH